MIHRRALLLSIFLTPAALSSQAADASKRIVERTATVHPIHYFVSLPSGWSSQRTWPVIVVIADAEREFRKTAESFADARGSLPFVSTWLACD